MKSLLLVLPLLLSGCDSYLYHSARYYDAKQRYGRAVEQYEAFLAREPSGSRAVLAHMRAGEIYTETFRRCLEARRHFEAAARLSPVGSAQNEAAAQALLSCPDYFPVEPGRRWVYGDSESHGRALRLEWRVDVSTGGQAAGVSGSYFAGPRRVRDVKARYERSDWMVWELSNGRRRAILRYPFQTGESWVSGSGADEERFRIEEDSVTVRTAAGVFSGCLKVRDERRGYSKAWTYDYYAPFVGKVKSTLGAPGFENPDIELIQFSD